MMLSCLLLSMCCLVFAVAFPLAANRRGTAESHKYNLFHAMIAGVFAASVLLFLPIHLAKSELTADGIWRTFLLSVFNALQLFPAGCEFETVAEGVEGCSEQLYAVYQIWAATLYVLAPLLTFGFVLSFFKNLSAYCKYLFAYAKDIYVFSELNERSFLLAKDLLRNHPKAAIVFTDVFEDGGESAHELCDTAKKLGAICFQKDITAIGFSKHAASRSISFFAMSNNSAENLSQSLALIEMYRRRPHTNLYVFSAELESELLLNAADKGVMKVRRINEILSRVNRELYERGTLLFDSAREAADGSKHICALVVGMGGHGTETLKALAWYGQMDGYTLEIHAFDRDPLAAERFAALAPELVSPAYNGVAIEGEAQYRIVIHAGVDVTSSSFAEQIRALNGATFATVSLGSDEANIRTAVNLRMLFEQNGIHPVIQAVVCNPAQKKALEGIRNFRGQAYDIRFFGDIESSCTENVLLDSELEQEALMRHLKWGKEEDFWAYEYNYRSSVASALHRLARNHCGIAGASKKEEELTDSERLAIEVLEHRRWNAYMRAQGYIYSGSKDKSTRNDLAKMHHDLIDYASLTEEEKRKDSRVGTL